MSRYSKLFFKILTPAHQKYKFLLCRNPVVYGNGIISKHMYENEYSLIM